MVISSTSRPFSAGWERFTRIDQSGPTKPFQVSSPILVQTEEQYMQEWVVIFSTHSEMADGQQ